MEIVVVETQTGLSEVGELLTVAEDGLEENYIVQGQEHDHNLEREQGQEQEQEQEQEQVQVQVQVQVQEDGLS